MTTRIEMLTCSAMLMLVACGDGGAPAGPTEQSGGQVSESDSDAGAPPAGPTDQGDGDSGGGDASASKCDVPSTQAELIDFLRARRYAGFKHETRRHDSVGPHDGEVLTYVNPTLAASLAAGNDVHPACSASVKELFLGTDHVAGWAVYVKTQADSADGDGFYWFETTSTDANAEPDYEGPGVRICVDCHASGDDFVLTRL